MRQVEISEVVDIAQYERIRADFRAKVLAAKESRRIGVGPNFMFLFENRLTVLYQVQEMMRTERIVEEKAIAHEVHTYNELIPPSGDLGATLLVEFTEPDERARRLNELVGIENHVHIQVGDLPRISGRFDTRQMNDEKISSVQYVHFPLEQNHRDAWEAEAAKGQVRVVVDHPTYRHEQPLTAQQAAALAEDFLA